MVGRWQNPDSALHAICYRFADCELDQRTRSLTRDGKVVSVEPKVFDFLVYLIEHRDRLVSKHELLAVLWQEVVVHESALARLAKEARRAVGDGGRMQHTIETRRGHGYRFAADVVELPAEGPVGSVMGYGRPIGAHRDTQKCVSNLGPGDTTAVDSTRAPADCSELAIRWVFPRNGVLSWSGADVITLGRSTTCDCVLDGAEVSRRHAQLVRVGPICGIRDLDSSNGTYVNGQRVSECEIDERDVIRCGEWVGLVLRAGELRGDIRTGPRQLAEGLWGGPVLAAALAPLELASSESSPIVIQGPPGTGKATMARTVHRWSGRTGDLIILAGRGSPDAVETWGPRSSASPGHHDTLKYAHGGTLVVENIIDWDLEMQRTLADALCANDSARMAGRTCVDARLVTTTDMAFSEAVATGRIDARLGESLRGVLIEMPALRARIADVPELFMRLLSHYSGTSQVEVTARVIERLCLYAWPCNVEELQALARQVASTQGSRRVVGRSDLPAELLAAPAPRRVRSRVGQRSAG